MGAPVALAFRFAGGCLAVYLAALIALHLRYPVYTTAKAHYLTGVTPCLAVLAAAGLDLFTRRPLGRALAYGWLSCWALSAYGAYFVLWGRGPAFFFLAGFFGEGGGIGFPLESKR